MTLDDLIAAVRLVVSKNVAMTTSPIESMDGLSFFFVGPKGRASSTTFGVSEKLAADDTTSIINDAAQQGASVE